MRVSEVIISLLQPNHRPTRYPPPSPTVADPSLRPNHRPNKYHLVWVVRFDQPRVVCFDSLNLVLEGEYDWYGVATREYCCHARASRSSATLPEIVLLYPWDLQLFAEPPVKIRVPCTVNPRLRQNQFHVTTFKSEPTKPKPEGN